MRKLATVLCLAGLMFGSLVSTHSAEKSGPRAIIDKAIRALGDPEDVAKIGSALLKGKGTYHGLGQPLPYTAEWAVQPPKQMRFSVTSSLDGKEFKMTQVINGDKGWKQVLDIPPMEMKKDELDEAREQLYADWVAMLVPLKQKGFKLEPLGKTKVGKHEAEGVRVTREGHRDVSLFFDSGSGLLVKSETRVKDVEAGGKELTQDVRYEDYKKFGGVKQATRVTIQRDGKPYVETEFTEIQPQDKIPPATFDRP